MAWMQPPAAPVGAQVVYTWTVVSIFLWVTYFYTLSDLLSGYRKCSIKMFLKFSQDSQENIFVRVFFFKIKAEVFSCEYCEIFKNTFL